jgi:hypothetical protein
VGGLDPEERLRDEGSGGGRGLKKNTGHPAYFSFVSSVRCFFGQWLVRAINRLPPIAPPPRPRPFPLNGPEARGRWGEGGGGGGRATSRSRSWQLAAGRS